MIYNRIFTDIPWCETSELIRNKVVAYKDKHNFSDMQMMNLLGCTNNSLMGLYHSGSIITYRAAELLNNKLGTIDISSVKHRIRHSPTLFDSSQTSGFVYKVVGCDIDGMHRLNYLDGFKEIIKAIKKDYSLEYAGCRNEFFEQNLRIVDSRMDEILHNAMLMQVGYLDGLKSSKIPDMSKALAQLNPIGVRNPEIFYEAKLKAFLFASFAGLTASKAWNGRKKLTGGYIDVGRDGELLYYRAISDDIFESYLFKHTYVDRPDRGPNKTLAVAAAKAFIDENRELSEEEKNKIIYKDGIGGEKNNKKEDFGYVYQEGEEFFIVINFKIRFS